MLILRADELGMCFGVRDALAALARIPDPRAVTIHGELVHNPEVLAMLARQGFVQSPEQGRGVPATPAVLITAHGISARERSGLVAAGKQLIDTTCPLVQKAHAAAAELAAEGRRVVVLGRADHVEVRGLCGDLVEPIVVASIANVECWPERRLGVISQTTMPVEIAAGLLAAIHGHNPHADIRAIDTICSPTKARQDALMALLPKVDALVVVGGRDSNNCRQLVASAERHGVRALHVANASELRADWFDQVRVLGLHAGTSTLARTVDEVHGWLRRLPVPPSVRAG